MIDEQLKPGNQETRHRLPYLVPARVGSCILHSGRNWRTGFPQTKTAPVDLSVSDLRVSAPVTTSSSGWIDRPKSVCSCAYRAPALGVKHLHRCDEGIGQMTDAGMAIVFILSGTRMQQDADRVFDREVGGVVEVVVGVAVAVMVVVEAWLSCPG